MLNSPADYNTLQVAEKELLARWIDKRISKRKTANRRYSSYSLKHGFEKETGVYVTNGQFKGAMFVAGYMPIDQKELNWVYRINVKYKRDNDES